MKKFALVLILGSITLVASAQNAPRSETVSINGSKISAPQQIRPMSAGEFSQFAGSYDLSNGHSLTLFSRGLQKFAAVEGGAWHELVATSSHSFSSRDNQLKVTIDRHENGGVDGELVMLMPSEHVAGGEAGTHVLALSLIKSPMK